MTQKLGNAFLDPYNQIDYGTHLHVNGLLDENEARKVNETTHKIQQLIREENFKEAVELFIPLVFNSDKVSMLYNYTGSVFHYNVLIDSVPKLIPDYDDFMQDKAIRRAFHVYPNTFNADDKVGQQMKLDILKTGKYEFAVLAAHYPTMLFNGQLDIICPPIFAENFLNKLDWKYSNEFYTAKRKVWRLADDPDNVAGYVKQVGWFRYVVIKRAGHMVPWDQPKVSLELMKNFIYDHV
jgi:vitellogenic carboxypeptidase-like protein